MSHPLIFGIAIFVAAVLCFFILVGAAFVAGYLQVSEEEVVLDVDEEARKAGL